MIRFLWLVIGSLGAVEQLFFFEYGVAGHSDTQLAEQLVVSVGEDDGGMKLATAELAQLFHRFGGVLVCDGADRQRQQQLVGVHTGVTAAQMLYLQVHDRLNDLGGDQLDLIGNIRDVLEGIEQGGRGCAQKIGGLTRYHVSVGELNGYGRLAGVFCYVTGGENSGTALGSDVRLVHEKLDLANFLGLGLALTMSAGGLEVAADDLLLGCLADGVVIENGVAYHVDAHVGGTLVGALAEDASHHGFEHAEDLNIAVIVNRDLTVGFQMIGVDHIHISEVSGSRLVGKIDGMLEGKIPHGEGFEFCIAGCDTSLVLVVELGEAGCHLTAAWTGGGDDHQGSGGFDIVVATKALLADDVSHIRGIVGDGIMAIDLDTQLLHGFFEHVGGVLPCVTGEHYASYVQTYTVEAIDKAHDLSIVGNTQVPSVFIVFDVICVDSNNDLSLISQGLKHTQLGIGGEPGEDTGGVVVVKQLASEFHIKLTAECGDTVSDLLRLQLDILLVAEAVSQNRAVVCVNVCHNSRLP